MEEEVGMAPTLTVTQAGMVRTRILIIRREEGRAISNNIDTMNSVDNLMMPSSVTIGRMDVSINNGRVKNFLLTLRDFCIAYMNR